MSSWEFCCVDNCNRLYYSCWLQIVLFGSGSSSISIYNIYSCHFSPPEKPHTDTRAYRIFSDAIVFWWRKKCRRVCMHVNWTVLVSFGKIVASARKEFSLESECNGEWKRMIVTEITAGIFCWSALFRAHHIKRAKSFANQTLHRHYVIECVWFMAIKRKSPSLKIKKHCDRSVVFLFLFSFLLLQCADLVCSGERNGKGATDLTIRPMWTL